MMLAVAPHITVFLIDDLGWNDVSMHGSEQIPTPNIDGLAADGIRLNNYYVNPVCSPTRASLMSGRSIIHHGIYTPYGTGNDASGLNLSYTTLPQHLKASYGYSTYMVGKWHLGIKSPSYLPSRRGFDRYFGYYEGVMDYWTHAASVSVDGQTGEISNLGLDLHLGGADFGITKGPDQPVYNTSGDYSTLMFARKASEWIEEHGQTRPKTPMFLYLAFQGAHSGDNEYVQAPAAYIERFDSISPQHTCGSWAKTRDGDCTLLAMRKSVAAAVSAVDDAVGDVVRSLHRAGMGETSLVVLSTDNGGPTDGADNNNMNNFPLRGCKGGYFEGGVRGVGLLHGYGLWKTGIVSEQLHHVNDWMPTLLSAAAAGVQAAEVAVAGQSNVGSTPHLLVLGASEPPMMIGDGIDNWAAFGSGAPSKRSEMVHVTQAAGSVLDSEALRVGDLKLLWHPAGTDCSKSHPGWYPPPGLEWDYANFTIKCSKPPTELDPCTAETPCLFNISADPCEHHNLASTRPADVKSLQARLSEYRATAVLSWNNFAEQDPRADSSHFGAIGEYRGVQSPWLTESEAATYYPTNYSGPGGV